MNLKHRYAVTALFAIAFLITTGNLVSAVEEADLIAVLKSEAPKSEKAITCKLLAVHGSKQAVAELAKLLPDEQLTSWARTALEAIPDPAAAEALRSAMLTMERGRPLIGVINSIAARRDKEAVHGLVAHLKSTNEQVAVAAAVALGHIGQPPAQAALESILINSADARRSAAAEGCILLAEQLLASSQASEAAALYQHVREANVSKQRWLEATRGLVLANRSTKLLAELLRSSDKDDFGLALRTAGEMPDQSVTNALVAALGEVPPSRQSFVVLALAHRDRDSVLPAILELAKSGTVATRCSALEVLGRIGDESALDVLLGAAAERDETISQSAKAALAAVPDARVDALIKQQLPSSKGAVRKVLIEAIGARQVDAVPALLKAASDADASVRATALTALGATVAPIDLSKFISRVTDSKFATDRQVGLKALRAASTRMPDRDACAAALSEAMDGQPLSVQASLIEILGQVGGARSLREVANAAADSREALKDAASQALGRWMTPDAAPVLIKLAQPRADEKYRIRALRGYLRIARQMKLSDAERARMCEEALKVATRDAERSLALRVLEIHPSLDTLSVALLAKRDPALKVSAQETALKVAQGVQGHADDVRKLLEQDGWKPANIEILNATYGVGEKRKVVTDIIKRSVGKLPIVTLRSNSYNTAFEGDPAPGLVKQLVVEYRMDGRKGKASFQENATIVLPKP